MMLRRFCGFGRHSAEIRTQKQEQSRSMARDRITGINFARMMLAAGIIVFHYSCHNSAPIKPLYMVNGYAVGEIITTCFIMLSGAMMYYNHETVSDIISFWTKRFISIYPAFWIVYFLEYMNNAAGTGTLFWSGARKWTVLVSIAGMDGYLMSGGYGTYYILGEWFLGVILLLYALYPALSWLVKKSFWLTGIGIYAAYGAWLYSGRPFWFGMTQYTAMFYTGMLIIKYRKRMLEGWTAPAASLLVCILISVINIPTYKPLYMAYAVGVFVILQRIGTWFERWPAAKATADFIGGISYEIFLVQHLTILRMLRIADPQDAAGIAVNISAIMLVCVIYAKLLNLAATGAVRMFRETDASRKSSDRQPK